MAYKNSTDNIVQEEPIQEKVEEVIDPKPVEVVKPKPVKKAKPTKIGVVTNCEKLNVRKAASKDSDIVMAINALTEVTVDQSKSTREFYKITTKSNVEGYCMKKFIAVRP